VWFLTVVLLHVRTELAGMEVVDETVVVDAVFVGIELINETVFVDVEVGGMVRVVKVISVA